MIGDLEIHRTVAWVDVDINHRMANRSGEGPFTPGWVSGLANCERSLYLHSDRLYPFHHPNERYKCHTTQKHIASAG